MVFDREVYDLYNKKDDVINDILEVIKSKQLTDITKNHTLSYLLCSYNIETCLNNKAYWSDAARKYIEYNKYNFFFKVGLVPTYDKRKLQRELLKKANTLTFDEVKAILDEKVSYVAIIHDEFRKVDIIDEQEYYKNPRKALREAGIVIPVMFEEVKL